MSKDIHGIFDPKPLYSQQLLLVSMVRAYRRSKLWKVTRTFIVRAPDNGAAYNETLAVDYDGQFIGDGVEVDAKMKLVPKKEARKLLEEAGSEYFTAEEM